MPTIKFGGSFAPELNKDTIQKYKVLAKSAEPKVQDCMLKLIDMVEKFLETPKSKLPSRPHMSGVGSITPLEQKEIQRIWDFVPWEEELDAYSLIFNNINKTHVATRNAAFHLLWYGRELCLDREPITNESLGG